MTETLYKDTTSGYSPAMARKKPHNLRLDEELMDRLTAHAKAEGRSRNNLIDRIFQAYDANPQIRELVRQLQAPPSTD
jgi:predicted HicB family RNase H-like nuclease